jgi:hypothetical protein
MSAVEALYAAHDSGITVTAADDELLLEANARPPQTMLDMLARHKAGILDLLRPVERGWGPDQWRAYFAKKRGIAMTRGGTSNKEAEKVAFSCCVTEWLNQHPAPSAPGRCAWCREAESFGATVVPFGTEPGTHSWLHAECWCDWHNARCLKADAALNSMLFEHKREPTDKH